MNYAALSPHVGHWQLRDDQLGDSSLRGGAINWGNLGSRISSALSSTGRWLHNAGSRFVNSQAFGQIKQGLKDSGLVQNVASLAGETLSALTDIGRLKLQQDLEKLRRKALGEDGPTSQAELQALIQALQAQVASASEPAASAPLRPTTRPIPEMVTEVRPAPTLPGGEPTTLDLPPPPSAPPAVPAAPAASTRRRNRKRARPGSWRARLDTLAGKGVASSRKRMCY
ncbi:pVI [Turkey adenovirus 1]|uniref:PVI n=1 Tax=Turkey adenovirus 1 TaxID=878329 RepID=E0YC67_9ADEN|nr:pVI [Turkey adenovirus 1]ADM53800.1 pVI [Turkey adenovirus 1]